MNHFSWLWADHGHFYGPSSGWIPDVTLFTGLVAWWHKHACQEDGCRRLGHHITAETNGHHFRRCRRHHLIRHTQPEGATR